MAAAEEGEATKQLEQEGDHRTRIFSGSEPMDQPVLPENSCGAIFLRLARLIRY